MGHLEDVLCTLNTLYSIKLTIPQQIISRLNNFKTKRELKTPEIEYE